MKLSNRNKSMIISFLDMRRIIGVSGILLPVIVILGAYIQNGLVVQGSISSYYYTNMRDFFVGLLSGVGLFLISYKGYELVDNIVTNLSGLFALGIVLFPTARSGMAPARVGIFQITDNVSEYIHITCAAMFFLLLAFNSIFLFTRHHPGPMGREKKKRNRIYAGCGIVMALSMLGIFVYKGLLADTWVTQLNPILALNTVALFAFGTSWLVKGHTMFKDKNGHNGFM